MCSAVPVLTWVTQNLISTHVTYPNVNPNPNNAKNVEFVYSNNGNRLYGVTYLINQPSTVLSWGFGANIKNSGLVNPDCPLRVISTK